MPQMAPMLWMIWMCLFWTVTLIFMLVNYFSGGKLIPMEQSQSDYKPHPKVNHSRVFADILNKFMNE